jgi:hypothetical protein
MNFKEFIHWRHDCFFCQKDMFICQDMDDTGYDLSLEGNYCAIASRYVAFSFHMETGELDVPDKLGVDLHAFLTRQSINVNMVCLNCSNINKYSYVGCFRANVHTKKVNMEIMTEHVNLLCKFKLSQFIIHPRPELLTAIISPQKRNLFDNEATYTKITTPYLNLFKMTPESLEKKIKTYILFS